MALEPSKSDDPLSPSNMLGSPPFSLLTYPSPAYLHLPSVISSDLKARRSALVSHKDLKSKFMESGVTYHRQLYLKNTAARAKLTGEFQTLVEILYKIANELLMEELEVVLWSIYIDQSTSDDLENGEVAFLWLSAFAAKQYFSMEASGLESVCSSQVSGFVGRYEAWRQRTSIALDVSLAELNAMVTALSQPIAYSRHMKGRDYNVLVTELITAQDDHRTKPVSN